MGVTEHRTRTNAWHFRLSPIYKNDHVVINLLYECAIQPHIMAPIKSIEYFRVKPRWLFVKIVDENDQAGWGEGTLEGHTLAVEGALDELKVRLIGLEAK